MQQRQLMTRLRRLLVHIALADLVEHGQVVPTNSHQIGCADEAVHFDQLAVVGADAVDDEVKELVVLVELGALTEPLGILYRQRMEVEDVAQDRHVVRVG